MLISYIDYFTIINLTICIIKLQIWGIIYFVKYFAKKAGNILFI
jgi:hypothetical protein